MKAVAPLQKIPGSSTALSTTGKATHNPLQLKTASIQNPLQLKKENITGLPDSLKAGVEALSGFNLDDVQVHYNSDKPAQLQANAYAQGTDIHIAPGQEKHLPHEAWHVVQQKQGRVRPTMQMKSKVSINDEQGLEREADKMGLKASLQLSNETSMQMGGSPNKTGETLQRQVIQRVLLSAGRVNINVTNKDEYPTWTWTDGKQYHINYGGGGTKHVTIDGDRVHFFFETDIVGTNWVIKSVKPTKAERGKRKKDTKKGFDELPADLQAFIQTHYQAIMDL